MNGYKAIAGVLSTAFLSGALANPVAGEAQPRHPDPRAGCFITETGRDTSGIDVEGEKARLDTCLIHVEATQLIKQGRTNEALELLSRSLKPRVPALR